jgi:hypothetical protein
VYFFVVEQFVAVLELLVLFVELVVFSFILLECLVVSAECLDDEVLLVGLHSVGGGDEGGLVVSVLTVLLAAVALHLLFKSIAVGRIYSIK